MGYPMAKNLLKKFGEIAFYDVVDTVTERMAAAGGTRMTLAEIAENCEVVFMMLPNGRVCTSVVEGEDGVTSVKDSRIRLLINTSSVTPGEAVMLAKTMQSVGADYLDCPVSGGVIKAEDGTLSLMIGGKEEAFKAAEPYLDAIASSVVRIGDIGSGSVTKLANQVIVTALLGAVGEAYTMASKAGADPASVYKAIRGGLAQNTLMDNYIPKILKRDFEPGGTMAVNLKDVNNILATCREFGCAAPITTLMKSIMESDELKNSQMEDHRAVIRYFEQKAGVEIRPYTE